MGWIIFIILIVAICWTTFGRNIFINLSQRKENSFEIEQPLDRETLMEILRTKVQYPDAKEIFYNENGEITVHCKYAQHIVRCNEKRVHVIKDWPEVKKPQGVFQWILFILLLKEEADTFQAKCIEEADCLYAYILKAFYPDAPINAPIEKATMDRHYRTRKFVIIGLCGALIALLIVSLIHSIIFYLSMPQGKAASLRTLSCTTAS